MFQYHQRGSTLSEHRQQRRIRGTDDNWLMLQYPKPHIGKQVSRSPAKLIL
jgi:hypothetical protein